MHKHVLSYLAFLPMAAMANHSAGALSTAVLTSTTNLSSTTNAHQISPQTSEQPSITEEHVEVIGRLPNYLQTLSDVLPQTPLVDGTRRSTDSIATLLNQSPAINFNGQGGLFQTVNIRGFARWRIQTLVEGIPVYTERRAGTAAEFLPPAMLGQAYLTEGAASTQLGSGAIGGGLDLYLARPEEHTIAATYGENQRYRDLLWQGHADIETSSGIDWQLNHRNASNGSDASGNTLWDGFEQHAASVRYRSEERGIKDSVLLYSSANNIYKASADLPEKRSTLYPTNDHLLGKVTWGWHNTEVYFHQSRLNTQIHRPGKRTNFTQNEALDVGVRLSDHFSAGEWSLNWRAGVDGRTGVTAREQEVDDDGHWVFDRTNLDAEQWEASLAMDAKRPLQRATLVSGARLSHQQQRNLSQNKTLNDGNSSLFIGYRYPINESWVWSSYFSTAYRVPSLTERFFNGATPRGTVRGDENLRAEEALNVQTNLMFSGEESELTISGFSQHIDHYIERRTLTDELRQYRNLDQATINGIQYQWQWSPLHHTRFKLPVDWAIRLGGQWLRGEDASGEPIADIAPAQHQLRLSMFGERIDGFFAVMHRQGSDDEVNGELPTVAVTTLDAGMDYPMSDGTTLSFNVTNITNRLYVMSRDDLAPNARGRDVQVSVKKVF